MRVFSSYSSASAGNSNGKNLWNQINAASQMKSGVFCPLPGSVSFFSAAVEKPNKRNIMQNNCKLLNFSRPLARKLTDYLITLEIRWNIKRERSRTLISPRAPSAFYSLSVIVFDNNLKRFFSYFTSFGRISFHFSPFIRNEDDFLILLIYSLTRD